MDALDVAKSLASWLGGSSVLGVVGVYVGQRWQAATSAEARHEQRNADSQQRKAERAAREVEAIREKASAVGVALAEWEQAVLPSLQECRAAVLGLASGPQADAAPPKMPPTLSGDAVRAAAALDASLSTLELYCPDQKAMLAIAKARELVLYSRSTLRRVDEASTNAHLWRHILAAEENASDISEWCRETTTRVGDYLRSTLASQ